VRRCGLITAALFLLAAAPASAATKIVVTGKGWGHGVGMSQWGAYGYARHGWSWQRILGHYYPGTHVSPAPLSRVRVLLATAQPKVAVACPGTLKVSDATGRTYSLSGGSYRVGRALVLPVGTKRVKVAGKRHAHHESFATVRVRKALASPLVFDCPSAPVTWNGRAYHGLLVVRKAKKLSVVNSLALDDYVRGVVGGEMPDRWSMAALESQAVAARTYALATLHPNKHFDLFSDTRSQVYGGVAYETERTNLAVSRTAGKVLTYRGRIATTFFFSTSGGRTADVREVWPTLGDVPYLRSVSDPYDASSPHHAWQVVLPASKLPAGDLRLVRAADGRVSAVVAGSKRIPATDFRRSLGLQSTWFDIARLSITSSVARVRYGGKIELRTDVEGLGRARLERRIGAGRWKPLATVGGSTRVDVEPRAHTIYRLDVAGIVGPEVTVDVAPRLDVTPAGAEMLAGSVEPISHGAISVYRRVAGGWKLVAHPRLDTRGTFHAPLRLQAGAYRVRVDDDGRYASAEKNVKVTSRLLASFGY
jgi:stage II sporulation protein D